jgi:hypothetical protein
MITTGFDTMWIALSDEDDENGGPLARDIPECVRRWIALS